MTLFFSATETALLGGAGLFLLGLAVGLAVGTKLGRGAGERVALARLPLEMRERQLSEDRCPLCGREQIDTRGALCYHLSDIPVERDRPCDL